MPHGMGQAQNVGLEALFIFSTNFCFVGQGRGGEGGGGAGGSVMVFHKHILFLTVFVILYFRWSRSKEKTNCGQMTVYF